MNKVIVVDGVIGCIGKAPPIKGYDNFPITCSRLIQDEFTDEEIDFIVNYDVNYRLGADADEA